MVVGQVGSPTRQWVMLSPFAAIQSRRAMVPSVESPSSSPVIASTTAPSSGGVCVTKSMAAAAKQATPDFMSVAPRPYMRPSRISAPKGSAVQAAASPTGTTSVCPLKPKVRAAPFSPAGKEVGDAIAVGAETGEARGLQPLLQQDQRTALFRRDGGAADQLGGQGNGIGGRGGVGGHGELLFWANG